jgi:Holliday junction resolvasome RuvABC endonuclease subunit
MNSQPPKRPRVLAIAPSTRGFGFAVMEGQEILVDWGVKAVKRGKNARCVALVEEFIDLYQPEVLAIEDLSGKNTRHSNRIRLLGQQIVAVASKRKIRAETYSRMEVNREVAMDERATKHARASQLAERFPEELGHRLPPKRRAWDSQDYRMDIFDALALALIAGRKLSRK